MFTRLLETGAELMTSRRQLMMTSLVLLLTFNLVHQSISYVDVSRQNSVAVHNDDNDNYDNNNNNNNTGWTARSAFCYI